MCLSSHDFTALSIYAATVVYPTVRKRGLSKFEWRSLRFISGVPPKGLATSPLQQRALRGWNEERRAFQGPDPGPREFEGLCGSAVWESMEELSPSPGSGKINLFMQLSIQLYIPLK